MDIKEKFIQTITRIDEEVYNLYCQCETVEADIYREVREEEEVRLLQDKLSGLEEKQNHLQLESIILKRYYRKFFKESLE